MDHARLNPDAVRGALPPDPRSRRGKRLVEENATLVARVRELEGRRADPKHPPAPPAAA